MGVVVDTVVGEGVLISVAEDVVVQVQDQEDTASVAGEVVSNAEW